MKIALLTSIMFLIFSVKQTTSSAFFKTNFISSGREEVIRNIVSTFEIKDSTSGAIAKLKRFARRDFFRQLDTCYKRLVKCVREISPDSCVEKIKIDYPSFNCSPDLMRRKFTRSITK